MPFDFKTVFQRALPYARFLDQYGTADNKTRWQASYDQVRVTTEQRELLDTFRRPMNVLCMAGAWCGDCANSCPIFQRIAEACPKIDLRFVNRARDFGAVSLGLPGGAQLKTGTENDPDDIRSTQLGKILVRWGILTPERVEKALLMQEEQNAQGLNARIGDIMTGAGMITPQQRDQALAAQSGYENFASWDEAVAKELMTCGSPRVPMLVFLSQDWFECERYAERTLRTYREKAKKYLSNLQGASCPTGLGSMDDDLLTANVAEWLTHFERVQWMLLTSPRLQKLAGEV